MTATLPTLSQALAGRYAIGREIGAGGMALVYLATDLKHHRPVAIKVLRPELAATIGGDRFIREIEFAAQLSHPHILPLFDSGAAGDLLYYVMPFVAGESLRSRLTRERRLPVEAALRLTREVASAIGFAHQRGVVHRDIKPENILLADDIALVADFGIARAVQSGQSDVAATGMTAAGFALGTPAYMSPEQFAADEVDGRADIYSLGCVLYEMLSGEPPFSGSSMEALLRKHLTEEPRKLNELRPEVPRGIAQVVARALAKDPGERFPSAASFAEAIVTVTTGGATPPEFSMITTTNNLPRQRTRFIGRERELAECQRLLKETRLLTLTGIGGSGKTRLSLRIAESALSSYPGGVWFVDLAALQDPQRIGVTVAEAIGTHEEPDKPIAEVLVNRLVGKRSLMVLDNCEHLLNAAADLVDMLLARVDGITLIATSREGLGIEGERLFAVRSMSVPPLDLAEVHAVEQADAVRLFVDRARAVRADFSLGPENAAAIAEICRRLDGIPLALELAAARVKVLSVEQIRAKLDDRFRLLTGGRSAVARQQTLLATMQWSYEQLSEDEQRQLRALSVFSGGWRLGAATAVAGADADEFEVLDVLTRLIDKSLVLVEHVSEEETRYTMLETVRQYAHERLVECGESEAARRRHFEFYAAKAEDFYAERFVREKYWTERLTREHDNLRAALSFARDTDPERFLEMAGALAYFWWGRSHMIEGREYIEDAVAMTADSPPRLSRARALQGLGMLAANQGDAAVARKAMEDGLSMWRELGHPLDIAVSLEALGWAKFFASEDEDALATFQELVQVVEPLPDPVMLNRAKRGMGQVLVALSRTAEARAFAHEVLAFAQQVGDPRSEHSGYHFLADCALLDGDCEESLGLYRKSLLLTQAIGARFETTAELEGIAMSLAGLGEHARAVRLVAASRAEWERLGVNLSIRFWDALHERYMTPARAALGAASTAEAERAGRAMSLEAAIDEAMAEPAPLSA